MATFAGMGVATEVGGVAGAARALIVT